MSDLDNYRGVLGDSVRAVWPNLAAAVAGIDGALFGGTALATHLQHRQSFDLDYMTYQHFDGEALARRLAVGTQVDVRVAAASQLRATAGGVVVEVFTAPHPSDDPSKVQQIAAPRMLDGLAVASLADLLASKLDVVLWRAKPRDFIDIAAIDQSSQLRIEDGLRLHTVRYSTTLGSGVLDEIVDLLEDPGPLPSDPAFAAQASEALAYLADRAPALRDYLANARAVAGRRPPGRAQGTPEQPEPNNDPAMHDKDSAAPRQQTPSSPPTAHLPGQPNPAPPPSSTSLGARLRVAQVLE